MVSSEGPGQGCRDGLGNGLVDQGHDLGIDGVHLRVAEITPASLTLARKMLDAVVVLAVVLVLARRAIGLRIAFEMAEEADHLAFQQGRAAAFAGASDNLAGRLVDGEEIKCRPR